MDTYVLVGILLVVIVFIFALAVILPKFGNKSSKEFDEKLRAVNMLLNELGTSSGDARQLRLNKITTSLDNVLAKILEYYGCMDQSVNQKIRQGMDKKLYDYEAFKVLKSFHLMRNRVVHEDTPITKAEEQNIFKAFSIIKKLR